MLRIRAAVTLTDLTGTATLPHMPPSDLPRLRHLQDHGRLAHPRRDRPGAVDLYRALAAIAGAPSFPREAHAAAIAQLIGNPRHLVFVLADGLGMNLIDRLPADSFLRGHLAMCLNAVFPSSTAPALTALATGAWPAEHAVPTWFTHIPHLGRTAVLLPYQYRGTDIAVPPGEAALAFPLSAQARYFQRPYGAFTPARIRESTFTRYSAAGAPVFGYQGLEHAVNAIAAATLAAPGPTYSYLYYPDVDSNEHQAGVESRGAWEQLLLLDRELARLRRTLGSDATIVVSADHGQVTVPDDDKWVLPDGDELRRLLRVWPPAGEPRLTSFHVRPGSAGAFAEAFRLRFGEHFLLLSADESESANLFGPGILSPEARGRIGDFIALPVGMAALVYGREPHILAMKGMHGGLSPQEMRIPLVIA